MAAPLLKSSECEGVALLGDPGRPGGVTLAFTGRCGGVSEAPFDSLNLGTHVGDDPASVAENRRRVLAAMGGEELLGSLVVPNQVHGTQVRVIRDGSPASLASVREDVARGCDAIVCVAPDVPVMLCFADCASVVLACEGGFAVVHSGWRGTIGSIAGKALGVLCEETGCEPGEVSCYVGPHIAGPDYEVSDELLRRFVAEFGECVIAGERRLSLLEAIRSALVDAGADEAMIVDSGISTATACDRYFSYRESGGKCGRHGAVAFMRR